MGIEIDNPASTRDQHRGRRRRALGAALAGSVLTTAAVAAAIAGSAPARADDPICKFMANGRTPEQAANSVWIQGYMPGTDLAARLDFVRHLVSVECPEFLYKF